MGIMLRIVANVLRIAFFLPAQVHEIIDGIRYKDFWKRVNRTSNAAAFAIDVYCNVAYSSLLNAFFIKKGGYHYGAQGETVTSATGKNWTKGSLTIIGEGLTGTLNLIDRDHCYKYIMGYWPTVEKPAPVALWKSTLFMLAFLCLFNLSMWLAWKAIQLIAWVVLAV
jgi:hypothetical protein